MLLLSCVMSMSSCNSETELDDIQPIPQLSKVMDENTAITRFAEILSRATYEREDVRQFLKDEALKQFDKNYDVLYINVKDTQIGTESFKQILEKYAKAGELDRIEEIVPTINILVPEISMLGIHLNDLDCKDKEIPVVIPGKDFNKLLLDGEVVDSVKKGNLPGFHTFVVNKNIRIVPSNSKSRSNGKPFSFVDDEFDNSIKKTCPSRASGVDASTVGYRAINAFNYFYKDDNSNQSKALQRDYIYYGMTPTSTRGQLDYNVCDYLCYIEVDANTYTRLSDVISSEISMEEDPYIYKNTASIKKREFTHEELVDQFWTEGNYTIRVEIKSGAGVLYKFITVTPDDLWDFNCTVKYEHPTMFRHSKYTYTIDSRKFTSKRYYLPTPISLGKWNLSNEALTRVLTFYEEDSNIEYESNSSWSTTKTTTEKVSGDLKFGLGTGKDGLSITSDFSDESSATVTEKAEYSFKVKLKNGDDHLGDAAIFFYDPVIDSYSNGKYVLKDYYTGIVHFGITAK